MHHDFPNDWTAGHTNVKIAKPKVSTAPNGQQSPKKLAIWQIALSVLSIFSWGSRRKVAYLQTHSKMYMGLRQVFGTAPSLYGTAPFFY